MFDSVVAWYGMLPVGARGAVTLAVGLLVAWIAFRVAVGLAKGLVRSIVAAVLAFLLATVPGNLILHDAYSQLQERRPCRPSCDGRPAGRETHIHGCPSCFPS